MKPRPRRITLAAAVLGVSVIVLIVVTHWAWATVRDHLEVWWFQITTKTETIVPDAAEDGDLLHALALLASRPVIFAPDEFRAPMGTGADSVADGLQAASWDVVLQRFPRSALVLIRNEHLKNVTTSTPRSVTNCSRSGVPRFVVYSLEDILQKVRDYSNDPVTIDVLKTLIEESTGGSEVWRGSNLMKGHANKLLVSAPSELQAEIQGVLVNLRRTPAGS